jgi:hypothetical protein
LLWIAIDRDQAVARAEPGLLRAIVDGNDGGPGIAEDYRIGRIVAADVAQDVDFEYALVE